MGGWKYFTIKFYICQFHLSSSWLNTLLSRCHINFCVNNFKYFFISKIKSWKRYSWSFSMQVFGCHILLVKVGRLFYIESSRCTQPYIQLAVLLLSHRCNKKNFQHEIFKEKNVWNASYGTRPRAEFYSVMEVMNVNGNELEGEYRISQWDDDLTE